MSAKLEFDSDGRPKAGDNVSSVTDNGVGQYTVNFKVAFSHKLIKVIAKSTNLTESDVSRVIYALMNNIDKDKQETIEKIFRDFVD